MRITVANGLSFTPLDVELHDARSAIYAVVHRETRRVYVGMTKATVETRWRQHCYDATRPSRKHHFIAAIKKYGVKGFDVYVIENSIPDDELRVREAAHVRRLSADVRACGFNSTAGGDASPASHPEVRKKISESSRGKVLSAEHRAKLSAAGMGKKRSAEAIEKTAAHRRGMKLGDEWRAALSEAHKGKRPSEETRAKMSAAHRARHANGNSKAAQAEKMRARWSDPVYKARVSQRIHESKSTEEFKVRDSARVRVYSDETRAKLSAAARRRWGG